MFVKTCSAKLDLEDFYILFLHRVFIVSNIETSTSFFNLKFIAAHIRMRAIIIISRRRVCFFSLFTSIDIGFNLELSVHVVIENNCKFSRQEFMAKKHVYTLSPLLNVKIVCTYSFSNIHVSYIYYVYCCWNTNGVANDD